MFDEIFDIIVVDSVGVGYTNASLVLGGLGGSEMQSLLICEELAKNGKTVLNINNTSILSKSPNGVIYAPINILNYNELRCKTVILDRNTPLPDAIKSFDKILVRATDVYKPEYDIHLPLFANPSVNVTLLPVSNWQSKGFPEAYNSRQVLYNSIPDFIYDIEPNRNSSTNSFVYASAAIKGVKSTIEVFNHIKKQKVFKNAKLNILSPGYDRVTDAHTNPGVKYLGALPFLEMIEEMRNSRSMLYVSTFSETFCIVGVLAEILGLNIFVLQALGTDAMTEVMNSPLVTDNQSQFMQNLQKFGEDPQTFKPVPAKDYRVSTILPQWLELIG